MKTGNNITLFKKPKGLEKVYSKPWKRFHNPKKWHRKQILQNREVEE